MAQKSVNDNVIPKFYTIKKGTSSDKYFNDDEKKGIRVTGPKILGRIGTHVAFSGKI